MVSCFKRNIEKTYRITAAHTVAVQFPLILKSDKIMFDLGKTAQETGGMASEIAEDPVLKTIGYNFTFGDSKADVYGFIHAVKSQYPKAKVIFEAG